MNTQFHTPSFGDEVFDLTDVEPLQTIELTNINKYQQTSGPRIGTAEPVKPVSAYALFFRDTVSAIKAQNPNTSFEDISKIVHSMWQVLDPDHKNVYNKKNEAAKKEYIKQLAAYRNSQMRQSIQEDTLNTYDQLHVIQHPNISPKASQIASRPAVFTITRTGSDQSLTQHEQQTLVSQNNIVYCNNVAAPTPQNNTIANQNPQNSQILNDDLSVQICIRENCNKRAVINPDWEDEYCSNECVIIHCRNVFNHWVKSNLEGQV